jgi:AcrR family transcriptional regulator
LRAVTEDVNERAPRRRAYESPARREQAARTRERIVVAGVEIAQAFPAGDWRELTVRAVARRAGVNESTVYRHFATERGLRDAVMRQLERQAGVDVDGLRLEVFSEVVARVFAFLSTLPVASAPSDDPTFVAIDRRRRDALLAAVAEAAAHGPAWSEQDRTLAAAMLDIFWSVPTFERLAAVWGLDTGQATRAATWVIDLIETAIRQDQRP